MRNQIAAHAQKGVKCPLSWSLLGSTFESTIEINYWSRLKCVYIIGSTYVKFDV